MGVSTNAILFYGLLLPGGDDDEGDIDSAVAIEDWIDEWQEEYLKRKNLDWKNDYSIQSTMMEDCPVEIGWHCSGDYPMHYLSPKDAGKSASRGYPEVVDSLEVKPEWDGQIKEFCEVMGIRYSQPKWYLVSYWG